MHQSEIFLVTIQLKMATLQMVIPKIEIISFSTFRLFCSHHLDSRNVENKNDFNLPSHYCFVFNYNTQLLSKFLQVVNYFRNLRQGINKDIRIELIKFFRFCKCGRIQNLLFLFPLQYIQVASGLKSSFKPLTIEVFHVRTSLY